MRFALLLLASALWAEDKPKPLPERFTVTAGAQSMQFSPLMIEAYSKHFVANKLAGTFDEQMIRFLENVGKQLMSAEETAPASLLPKLKSLEAQAKALQAAREALAREIDAAVKSKPE